jgi:predicted dehydrogenase
MKKLNRRQFLSKSAALSSGLTALSASRVLGANNRVNVAVMGIRGRGKALAAEFAQHPDVDVTAVCDIDDSFFAAAIKGITNQQKPEPRVERDFRRLLDTKSIDALVNATPNHWHALATIWACQAGKDCYVEKPISHNMTEAKRMVEAVHKYKRVVQVGTQRRSAQFLIDAASYVRSGKLGKIAMARAWLAVQRPNIGHREDEPVPSGVDYDLWLGPAPQRPFNRNRFHTQWHWNWEYGGGELANNGVHGLDMARALLGMALPKQVSSSGGIKVLKDDRTTPDTQIVTWEYPDLTLIWEHRQWSTFSLESASWGIYRCDQENKKGPLPKGAYKQQSAFGVALYGDKGNLVAYDNDWEVYHGNEVEKHSGDLGGREHIANFIDCIRTRGNPNANIDEGFIATGLCHLGNIAYRLRRTLEFDPDRNQFINDDEANKLLGRTYRKPFVVPEKV